MAGILASSVNVLGSIIIGMIFVRVLLSWIPFDKGARWYALLMQLTEPILTPVRRLVQKSAFGNSMMFDISPIIAILLLRLLISLLITVIHRLL